MKIFIAGARSIKYLDEAVKQQIISMSQKGYEFLIGDCYGVDSSVQAILNSLNCKRITIYASNGKARNNIGRWNIKNIAVKQNVYGFDFYKQNGIRVMHIGDLSGLPVSVQTEILNVAKDTKDFKGLTVVLAINYGGRDEILRGIKKLNSKNIDFDSITEKQLSESFDIPELPDVDLLIRTGGEYRLSNFLLWHAAYAELLFTDTLWPDYNAEEFEKNIQEFKNRNRRFGAVLK